MIHFNIRCMFEIHYFKTKIIRRQLKIRYPLEQTFHLKRPMKSMIVFVHRQLTEMISAGPNTPNPNAW